MPADTTSLIDPRVAHRLIETHQRLSLQGELLNPDLLPGYYSTFRQRFGPDKLLALDGEELLLTLHAHSNKDSLVYWLEFKNDDELPGTRMGSIMGGSAHKFNLYRRQGTNQWIAGSSAMRAHSVTLEEAIDIARHHRDQLVAAARLLEVLNPADGAPAYVHLQHVIAEKAPDLWTKGWTHKYLSLLFPDKLDDYHSVDWQEIQLLQLLIPRATDAEGLYANACPFIRLAAEFRWPINHLSHVLNTCNHAPVRYWRIGTTPGGDEAFWGEVLGSSTVALGGRKVGDLSPLLSMPGRRLRDEIRTRMVERYQVPAEFESERAGVIFKFAARINEGDIVLAASGHSVLRVGRVIGPYQFDPTNVPFDAPHRRPVEWLATEQFSLPNDSFLFYAPSGQEPTPLSPYETVTKETTIAEVREIKHEGNLLAIERALLDATPAWTPAEIHVAAPVAIAPTIRADPPKILLKGVPGRIQAILERKGQVILHGPPGTGKTYWARSAARDLVAIETFGLPHAELSAAERESVDGTADTPGLVRACTFHPAYGYEDFLEGYRPQQGPAGQLVFERRAGTFLRICRDAKQAPRSRFILLVDEINRGDIPRIFGELLTLLEIDKRGNFAVDLPLSGESFTVPPNVWIIGTMNTADRSIALLDVALRRRFGFIELMPDSSILDASTVGGSLPLGAWLRALNFLLRQHAGRDARNLQIGHAYLLEGTSPISDPRRLAQVLADDLIPLLEEYCYEDYARLAKILGAGLVDESTQCVRRELFEAGSEAKLLNALLAMQPGIATLVDPEPAAAGIYGEEETVEEAGEHGDEE